MPDPITALYPALQGLLLIALEVPIGRLRSQTNVSIYGGGNPALAAAIRRHANWTEHVPLVLPLMALLAPSGASAGLLHGRGTGLLAAQIAHPFGLDPTNMRRPLPAVGALGTLLVSVVAVAALRMQAL